MKNGFTLVELLIVIVITVTVSAGSAMLFGKSNSDTNEEDLRGRYREIQRSAIIYTDLNDNYRKTLNESKEVYVKLGELQSSNFVDKNFSNTVTKEAFPKNYIVKIYVASSGDNEYLDSCVLRYSNGQEICIANSRGYSCGCCDGPESSFNKACNS